MLTTISDKKFGVSSGAIGSLIDYYEPDIVSANDYYPFGMVSRVGQTTTGVEYRFGFNGKENDKEPKDKFNQQDYGMRIYDPRVGRFLSVDPLVKKYPWYTPYQFAGNKPIQYIDLDGLEEAKPGSKKSSFGDPINEFDKALDATSPQFKKEFDDAFKNHPIFRFGKGVWKVLKGTATSGRSPNGPGSPIDDKGNPTASEQINGVLDRIQHGDNGERAEVAGELFPLLLLGYKPASTEFKAVPLLPSTRVTISLGLDATLDNALGVTYKNAGWQQYGLTRVDWGRAMMDEFSFKESFRDAARKADHILFDVTKFDSNYPTPKMTNYEFNHIISNQSLLQKTTFIENGATVTWNGTQFVKP